LEVSSRWGHSLLKVDSCAIFCNVEFELGGSEARVLVLYALINLQISVIGVL